MRILRSPAFWVTLSAFCIAVVANFDWRDQPYGSTMAAERNPLAKMAKEESLQREGTVIPDLKGRFRKQNDRYFFTEEASNRSYKCLENLCLQRIIQSQQDDDRKMLWLVSIKLTEFNGENLVLLEKAARTR